MQFKKSCISSLAQKMRKVKLQRENERKQLLPRDKPHSLSILATEQNSKRKPVMSLSEQSSTASAGGQTAYPSLLLAEMQSGFLEHHSPLMHFLITEAPRATAGEGTPGASLPLPTCSPKTYTNGSSHLGITLPQGHYHEPAELLASCQHLGFIWESQPRKASLSQCVPSTVPA